MATFHLSLFTFHDCLLQRRLYQLANYMDDDLLRFLDASGNIVRDNQRHRGQTMAKAAVSTQERNRFQPGLASDLQGAPNIWRFSARRQSNQDIARLAESNDLAGK